MGKRVVKILFLVAMLGGAISASAAVVTSTRNTTWERAKTINLAQDPAMLFGVLGSTGDARFFRLTVAAPTKIDATLDVPVWSDARFRPQLVVYQPDTVTASPALPIAQPPQSIGLVYPLTTRTKHFDQSTQVTMLERLNVTIEAPVAGDYYFAVYNADQQGGRWRLMLTDQTGDQSISPWLWPKRWWISQHWASPSPAVAYLPLLLVATIVFVVYWSRTNKRQPTHRKKKV